MQSLILCYSFASFRLFCQWPTVVWELSHRWSRNWHWECLQDSLVEKFELYTDTSANYFCNSHFFKICFDSRVLLATLFLRWICWCCIFYVSAAHFMWNKPCMLLRYCAVWWWRCVWNRARVTRATQGRDHHRALICRRTCLPLIGVQQQTGELSIVRHCCWATVETGISVFLPHNISFVLKFPRKKRDWRVIYRNSFILCIHNT